MNYGPTYPKINTAFKRDEKNRIIPTELSLPEFEYLYDNEWRWTEKIDGTNIRLYWDGSTVTLGARTDNAQVPAQLVNNLAPLLNDTDLWSDVFGTKEATVYGEGYGAKIQSGGGYRSDQGLIVFDVRIGRWWLKPEDADAIAVQLGLDVVPEVGIMSLREAIDAVSRASLISAWPGVKPEGIVGSPLGYLQDRSGQRIITKLKLRDFEQLAVAQ